METLGLQTSEAALRLRQYGYNEIQAYTVVSRWKIFARQWESPLTWLLCVAAGLALFLGDVHEAIAIAMIVFLNVAIGFFQESQAESAIVSLRKLVPESAKVIRDGQMRLILARELVPGDLVQLEAGDRVPADGEICEQANIAVDESILTGESFPVEKTSTVKAGTYLVRGTLKFEVRGTGLNTEFGKTVGLLSKSSLEETPLEIRLLRLSRQILWFCLLMTTVVVLISLHQGRSFWDVVLFGVSLLVASVPEGLPVMISLGLALGVLRMAKRNVLVRRLAAVETLGNVTYICTDKTGTLTYGQLELTAIESDDLRACLLAALSCSEASIQSGAGVGDPLELAVARRAWKEIQLHREDVERENPRTKVVPFDSETRSMKITRQDGWTYWKGAAEVLWAALPEEQRKYWENLNHKWTGQGYRTLGVAKISSEGNLHYLGLLVFSDQPRTEAKRAVADANAAGVKTCMLTGDQEMTAQVIATELNIPFYLARVKASDKVAKVQELKAQGHIVAMTGDGVNDAPALREAHVGVSMGLRGSEVAREASDIVLLDDNYASLIAAIKEGRGIFNNIRNSVSYLLMGNWAELVLIVFSSLLNFPLPLLASQLLWINLLTDGFPALVLMLEPAGSEALRQPPRSMKEALLRRRDWVRIIVFGFLEGLVALVVFKEGLDNHGLVVAQTMTFLVLVWSQILRLLNFAQSLRFWEGSHQFSAKVILICVFLSLLLQSSLVYFPWTRTLLSLESLSWVHWKEVCGASLVLPVIMWLSSRKKHRSSRRL